MSREKEIEVVAEVARGDVVVEAALVAKPDVALLDIEMPGGNGLEASQALRIALPSCRVVILTTFGRSGYLCRAMESGAVGFLLKDAKASELARALRRVMDGERVVDSELALLALSEGNNPLTNREREVLATALPGISHAEIATRISLSEGTVRNQSLRSHAEARHPQSDGGGSSGRTKRMVVIPFLSFPRVARADRAIPGAMWQREQVLAMSLAFVLPLLSTFGSGSFHSTFTRNVLLLSSAETARSAARHGQHGLANGLYL